MIDGAGYSYDLSQFYYGSLATEKEKYLDADKEIMVYLESG